MNFRRGLFILVLLIWIIAFIRIANADTIYDNCIKRCKTDVMQVDECIADERQYWENGEHIPRKLLVESCSDQIRNERQGCYGECAKEEAKRKKQESLVNFHNF